MSIHSSSDILYITHITQVSVLLHLEVVANHDVGHLVGAASARQQAGVGEHGQFECSGYASSNGRQHVRLVYSSMVVMAVTVRSLMVAMV